MIDLIHVSDIHFGSGEAHGRINPETGLNIRFEDFVKSLQRVVDYSIEVNADLFLFSGDAYRTASPEPIYQKMFARELRRLSKAGIKTVLVVGNHDQILRSTASHALSVFQSLEVPGLITIDQPVSTVLDTPKGRLQLIGLPHVTRHQLMTLEKYAQTSAAALDRILVEHIASLLKGYYEELDDSIPTVVTAHMTLDRAVAGIEEELLIGYTQTFPQDIFMSDKVDYVALGHVHKHQVLNKDKPAVVYAGSLDRVDFGEEKEDKGFVHVKLARKNTSYLFHSIEPRPFITVDAVLKDVENPTDEICRKIKAKALPGCVLRVRYKIEQTRLSEVDENAVRRAASESLTVRLLPELIASEGRSRLPQLNESVVSSPMVALETYLEELAPERKDRLLDKARQIMHELESRAGASRDEKQASAETSKTAAP